MPENRIKTRTCRTDSPLRRPWATRSQIVTILLMCGVLWHPVTAQAQDITAYSDDAQVLADLGSEDYAVRQAATRRLLQDDDLTQDDLDRLFVQCETPEQRHRLLRIARHHDIRRMIETRFRDTTGPGSMGLSHTVVQVRTEEADESQAQPRTGVMAALTLPGFPAYATMDPGDVIIEFDGQPIPEKVIGQTFLQMIKAKRAGDTIRMTVVRNGSTVEVQMTLNNSQALSEAYDINGVTLNNPYRKQWAQTREAMLSLVEAEGPDDDSPDAPATEPAP